MGTEAVWELERVGGDVESPQPATRKSEIAKVIRSSM